MEHKKIHVFPVLLRCEFNSYIIQLIIMINNRSILPQNRIELDIQSHKLTSAAWSFVIFQSQMHWLSVMWLFCSKPLLGSRDTSASIHKSGNFISTFKTRLELNLQTSL